MIRDGRLGKDVDEDIAEYTSSLDFDASIFKHDILGSIAHTIMLFEQGIIKKEDAANILKCLKELLDTPFEKLNLDKKKEDIHMVVEDYISSKIGDSGKKMHTARSRNDQIACDLRMKIRDELNSTASALIELNMAILDVCEGNIDTIMPGYTHFQHAQPTTLGHYLIAHYDALTRALDRLDESYRRVNLNPLGAGAIATTSFNINRERTAELLGFDGLIENSIDAVSSRDFILDVLSGLSILMIEISRIVEEFLLWSTYEFGFIELDDSCSSTSSMMPQKKNPDVLEVMRSRASRVLGNFFSVLSITKSLQYGYSMVMQEINPITIESFRITRDALNILPKILKSRVKKERMLQVCMEDFFTATELANLIVGDKNVPFRTAHQIVGRVVAEAIRRDMKPWDIDSKFVDEIAASLNIGPLNIADEKIKKVMDPLESVKAKKVTGGPSPEEVRRMLGQRKREITDLSERLEKRIKDVDDAQNTLISRMNEIISGTGGQ